MPNLPPDDDFRFSEELGIEVIHQLYNRATDTRDFVALTAYVQCAILEHFYERMVEEMKPSCPNEAIVRVATQQFVDSFLAIVREAVFGTQQSIGTTVKNKLADLDELFTKGQMN